MGLTLEDCFRLSDIRSDLDDLEASRALSFAACTAQNYLAKLERLAWACREANARKRNITLQVVLMELEAAGESLAKFPMREC